MKEIGSNAGPMVEPIQAATGNKPPDPWCASLIAYAGNAAFGADWPLPKSASCQALYIWGEKRGKTIAPEEAGPGDLMLVWFPSLNRHAHICVLTSGLEGGSFATIDGNSNDGGSREGWRMVKRTRTPKPQDAFLRWVD